MTDQAHVIHEVFYGANRKKVGFVEEGSSLNNFRRETASGASSGQARWVEIFGDGRSIVSLLVMPGVPVHTQSRTYNSPLD